MTKEEQDELRKNPINEFTCCGQTFKFKDFEKHLSGAHQIHSIKGLVGKKSAIAHIDGDKWFSWNYQWELESGLKFTQYVMQARTKHSMMH